MPNKSGSVSRIRQVLASHGRSIVRIRPTPAGINSAFRAITRDGQELFVKVRCSGEGGLSQSQYKRLANTGLPMPAMLGRYEFDEQHACEVYEFVHGDNAQQLWPKMSPTARHLIARHLAVFAATLDDLQRPPGGIATLNLRQRITETSETFRNVISPRHPLWRVVDRLPKGVPPRRFCHGDLNAKNVLVTRSGAAYLVDWEWAAMAEPAYEFKNTRAAAARGYRELGYVKDVYQALTGRNIAEERLLIADLDYSLVLLQRANRGGLRDWQAFHLRRLARTAERLQVLL